MRISDWSSDVCSSDLGFTAENLRAVHQGQPGRLALRAGKGHVRDRGNAFEAEVAATLDAHELLDYAPEMAWLKPRVSGRSPWTVALSIATTGPSAASAGPAGTEAQDRKIVVEGTSVSVRVDLGGSRIIQKQQN